jgi:hypothetical protein
MKKLFLKSGASTKERRHSTTCIYEKATAAIYWLAHGIILVDDLRECKITPDAYMILVLARYFTVNSKKFKLKY